MNECLCLLRFCLFIISNTYPFCMFSVGVSGWLNREGGRIAHAPWCCLPCYEWYLSLVACWRETTCFWLGVGAYILARWNTSGFLSFDSGNLVVPVTSCCCQEGEDSGNPPPLIFMVQTLMYGNPEAIFNEPYYACMAPVLLAQVESMLLKEWLTGRCMDSEEPKVDVQNGRQ